MNEIRFVNIVSQVPTCCLVEDYQMLHAARASGDWETVGTVMECMVEAIMHFTEVPAGLELQPGENLPVALCHSNGIIVRGNRELRCANGHPMSCAGNADICNSSCPYYGTRCGAGEGQILAEGEVPYVFNGDGSEFVEELEATLKKAEKAIPIAEGNLPESFVCDPEELAGTKAPEDFEQGLRKLLDEDLRKEEDL